MTEVTSHPFAREEHVDEPGILGARWWHRTLVAEANVDRRVAIGCILGATSAIALSGVGLATCIAVGSSGDAYRTERRNSLDMQKEYGWNFGAVTDPLTFDGSSKRPFDREALGRLPVDLRPLPRHAPFFIPTLFRAPSALPRSTPGGDTGTTVPLKDALTPIFTDAMDEAYRRGRALASLFRGQDPHAAVIVDLNGPEAVAFAAGSTVVFDPVFLFDNWPHPRGVVPAHLTLAAAAYYQPLFARRKAESSAPPMFVLDRARLNPYADDASQFDNRHVAQPPSAAQLQSLGIRRVLHVSPSVNDTLELDDLNDVLTLYRNAGIEVRIVGADAFGRDPSGKDNRPAEDDEPSPRSFYGRRESCHGWFWIDYPWVPRPSKGPRPVEPSFSRPGTRYTPMPRSTPFSGSPGASPIRGKAPGFGTVPVVVAAATGAVLGAKMSRSGTWLRTSGSSSWGGG